MRIFLPILTFLVLPSLLFSQGLESGGTESGGTKSGGTLAGDPNWDGSPPKEDPPPPGTGTIPDTFDEACTYTYEWKPSDGGVGGNGSAFQSLSLSYNDDGLGGSHRMCITATLDVTRSVAEGWGSDIFTFVVNNGSAVSQGSSPPTNAMVVLDCNVGLSIYEYDVNPANDFGTADPGGAAFADGIFDTAETSSLLGATYSCGPIVDDGMGVLTRTYSLCWDNFLVEKHFADLGADVTGVRPDEKIGIWGRNWGGAQVTYGTDIGTGGQTITDWDVAWPSTVGGLDTNSYMDAVNSTTITKVPEPMGAMLVGIGNLFFLRRRRGRA